MLITNLVPLRLKVSPIYRFIRGVAYPKYKKNIKKEANLFKYILNRVDENTLVFDLGAYEGDISYLFCKKGSSVVAIEPDPVNFKICAQRLKIFPKCIVLNLAVSSSAGKVEFYRNEKMRTITTLSQKWKDFQTQSNKINYRNEQISTKTLDQLISDYGVPDLIKIDVEGHELEVLTGLAQVVPKIIFEANLPLFLEEAIQSIEHLSKLEERYEFGIIRDFEVSRFRNAEHTIEKIKNINSPIDVLVRVRD